MTFDEFIQHFPGGRMTPRGEYETHCLGHDDKRSSLGIRVGDNGGIVMKCQAGCTNADILAAAGLKLRDLAPPGQANGHAAAGETVYLYHDDKGEPLFEVVRTADKHFWQRLPGAKKGGVGNVKRVLFDLPQLMGTAAGDIVFIVEGEKDCWRLWKLGLPATTNPGGAGKWLQSYTDWLKERLPDRRFVILPDNDPPGIKHGEEVEQSLKRAGVDVRTVALPGLPAKGDVSDWLAAGHSKEELLESIRPPPPKLWSRVLSFADLLTQPAPSWLIEDFAFEETMAEIYGPPNEGKTFLAVDLCMSIRRGAPWCGRSVDHPGPVLYVNADGGPGFADRGRAWVLIHGESEAPHEFWTLPEPINLYREDAINELGALIRYFPEQPVLLVIDTYSRCIPGVNENQQEFASLVVDNLTRLMREFHLSTWLLHHTDKTGKHDRGSSVILGACDTQVRVSLNQQTRTIELKCEKQRDNAFFAPIYFELGRVPGTNETWITWREEAPPVKRQDRSEATVEAVRAAIAADPGMTRAQLYIGLDLPESTLRRHLFKLLERGQIVERELPRAPGKPGAPLKGLYINGQND